jgi:hypothetical protein
MKKPIAVLIFCFVLMVWTFISLSMDSSNGITGAIGIFIAIAVAAILSIRVIIKKSRVKEAQIAGNKPKEKTKLRND